MYIHIHNTHPDTRTTTLRFISKDRFDRVLRYWARGPLGCESALTEEPWVEVNWMIDGHNTRRKKEFRCGSRITPDESMVTWTGNAGPGGIPHLSFIRRKLAEWKPGGGPTQHRGEQRSGGGERVVADFCFCGARGALGWEWR